MTAELLQGEEEVVYAAPWYQGIAKRPEKEGKPTRFQVAMLPGKRWALPGTPDCRESPGNGRHRCKVNVLAALINLYLARRQLMATG